MKKSIQNAFPNANQEWNFIKNPYKKAKLILKLKASDLVSAEEECSFSIYKIYLKFIFQKKNYHKIL